MKGLDGIGRAILVYGIVLTRVSFDFYSIAPYMDEIFHVPQALAYCQGNLHTWDDKITTYPGLYIVSAITHWLSLQFCSAGSLRFTNVIFACALFPLLIKCRQQVEQSPGYILNLLFSKLPRSFLTIARLF
jgi:hypothetical protein